MGNVEIEKPDETPYSEDYTEGLSIKIEQADDVPNKEKKTPKQQATDFVKGLFGDKEEETTTKNKGGRPPKSGTKKTFQSKAKHIATALIWVMSKTMPGLNEKFILSDGEEDKVCQLLPTLEEAQEIVIPLLRIVDRHTKVSEINPDVSDVCESLWAIAVYGYQTHANLVLLQALKEMEYQHEKDKQNGNSSLKNFESRGPNERPSSTETEASLFS
jgi:hypothetical protein